MRRLLVPALAAGTALLVSPAYGVPRSQRPQITDAKGDSRGGMPELDILSARWSTTGRGDGMRLVATLTLAAPPKEDVPYIYDMKSEVAGCGTVWFQYTPGTVMTYLDELPPPVSDGDQSATLWLQCHSVSARQIQFTRKGATISWSVPVAALGPIEPGALFSTFSTIADVGEPVFGHSVQSLVDQSLDNAFGDGTWRMR